MPENPRHCWSFTHLIARKEVAPNCATMLLPNCSFAPDGPSIRRKNQENRDDILPHSPVGASAPPF